MDSFRLTGLPHEPFAPLFDLPDPVLAERGMRRVVADADSGYPCRVSLADAAPGDELLLLSYLHQPTRSPYRASGPIFLRRGAVTRVEAPGTIPAYIARRLISVRAYDAADSIVASDVCPGSEAGAAIVRLLAGDAVRYLHLHFARHGCFACRVERTGA